MKNEKLKIKNLKAWIVIFHFSFFIFHLIGCATIPKNAALPVYYINGRVYYPLDKLCALRGISWQYDTFTRSGVLAKLQHKVSLRLGDSFVLVDGAPRHFIKALDLYQGSLVVTNKFKEQIIDGLFNLAPSVPAPAVYRIKKVVLDAGHGGHDPGTIGKSGLKEKDVNLDIVKRLSGILKADNIEVVMIRSTDRFIPLPKRAEIANNSGADIFVSIHSNANRVRSINGFEVYYVSPVISDTSRAYTAAKNAALNLDDSCFASRSLTLNAILWDMVYTSNRSESIVLSKAFCRSADVNLDCKVLGIKGAGFYILKGSRIPAVLIEVGFLSNSSEERKLKSPDYRQKIAEAVALGIEDYAKETMFAEVLLSR